MHRLPALLIVVLLAPAALAAQLYRWVDADGRVEWRDTPPPTSAGTLERKKVQGNVIAAPGVLFAVQRAARDFPVTLWTAKDCGALCEQARQHLARRGIPHAEKDASAERATFEAVTSSREIPVLFVGREPLKGYAPDLWNEALDRAGYPNAAR